MRRPPRDDDPDALRSVAALRFFRFALRRQLRRSFHAVRLARPGVPDIDESLPLIVYANHPSWWDGASVPIVLDLLFPRRRLFGPIDAEALERYGFMRRLGFFGVERDSYAGAARFLRIARRLLAKSDTLFCLTPEGRFADPRQRPVRLEPGLAAVIAGVPRVTVLPMAVEYPFWSERLPEALACFGEPMVLGRDVPMPRDARRTMLEQRLAATMDRLAGHAIERDASRFVELFEGRVGVGGIYDVGRRIDAWARGRRFDAAHVPRQPERR